jgi:hypothetical protein
MASNRFMNKRTSLLIVFCSIVMGSWTSVSAAATATKPPEILVLKNDRLIVKLQHGGILSIHDIAMDRTVGRYLYYIGVDRRRSSDSNDRKPRKVYSLRQERRRRQGNPLSREDLLASEIMQREAASLRGLNDSRI